MPLPPTFHARLVAAQPIAPQVRELVFESQEGALAFDPGQWVNLVIQDDQGDGELRRAYSIASAPDGSPRFDIAVTRVLGGPGSGLLHALEPGAIVRAIGPQGFFTRKPSDGHPSLFVGTGTGVTPLRSMIRAAVSAGSTEPLWLLLGARHEPDLLYVDELRALSAEHPNVRFVPTLSRPHEGWTGRTGYVQTHVAELWAELGALAPDAPPHLYVCGLERMVKSVRDLVRKDLGVPRERVHSERYD